MDFLYSFCPFAKKLKYFLQNKVKVIPKPNRIKE